MANLGKRIYYPASERWRQWLGPLKRGLLIHRSLRLVRSEFEIACGTDGPKLPCAYLGEGLSLPYYRKLYGFAGGFLPAPVFLWNLRQEVCQARLRFPVVLVEVNQSLGFLLPAGGLVTYPWIRQETDLEGEHYRHRQRGIERGVGQRVRKHGFQCRFSREECDLEEFYRTYHLPHVRARHGALAVGRTLRQLKSAMRSGFLLQVWRGDQWLSGVMVQRIGPERIYPLSVGLHPSCLAGWQDGSLAAAYYFLFRWARENGVRVVDFGGSPPHAMDGVFHHKTLWAAEPKYDPWHHTQLVFYVDAAAALPGVVTQQLVWKEGRFVTIAEALAIPDTAEAKLRDDRIDRP
jgi:hypothetical protein